MKIEQIKAKIEALTLNPDNVLEYQEDNYIIENSLPLKLSTDYKKEN